MGGFDAVASRYGVMMQGATEIAVTKLDVLMRAEAFDLCADLAEVIDLLPSATFTRTQLCDQMNSILSGHGWGGVYGTVE